MKGFFEAQSVAVIGVSARPGNLAKNIVANLKTFNYQGEVYYVSPTGGEYRGQPVYTDIGQVPGEVELAVILTPAATVPGIMAACGQKGIKRVIVESGGFGELDASRGALEQELDAAAAQYGIRFIGPNCIGIISTDIGLAVPFPILKGKLPLGGVSIVAQSGGVGLTYLGRLTDDMVGIARFAAVGNKQNVNEQALLAYLIQDQRTEVILLYLESIVAGRQMFDLIRSTDKPVIVHKSNIAETSQAIASSHTAALANDDLLVSSALEQCGAVRVNTVHDCLQAVKGATLPRAKGKRVAVISRSGGHAVVAADEVHRQGLELPALPGEYLEPIQEAFRASVIKLQNPLDLGDLFNLKLYIDITKGALALDQADSVLLVHAYRGPENESSREFLAQARRLCQESGKPLAMVLLTDHEELEAVRGNLGLPVFDTPEAGVLALAVNQKAGRPHRPHEMIACSDDINWEQVSRISAIANERGELELPEALHLLMAARIPVADFGVAVDPAEAVSMAAYLDCPVALKAVGAEVSHKTEQGGVVLGLSDSREIEQVAKDMIDRLDVKRLVVMGMVTGGTEVILGAKHDPAFGPLVLFGLGGTAAEAYGDVALRLAPVDDVEAGGMIDAIRASRLLKGFRGAAPVNRMALMEVIMRVSLLASRVPAIAELDINPLLVGPGGAVAVDARCRIDTAQ